MLLSNQVAIITGAARGLGRAIAQSFAENGARVVVADLDANTASAVAEDLPGEHVGLACDVASEPDVAELFASTIARFDDVHVVVNNAGITRDAMIHKMDLADFREVMEIHLQGSWLTTRAALSHMRSREGGGAIVNISSLSGKVGNLGQTNYSAAKAGLVGLTKASAREGARFGVRVNAIQPGLIATPMTEAMPGDVLADKAAQIPLGRLGVPADVASSALFLASGMSSYITGAVLEVTGGRGM